MKKTAYILMIGIITFSTMTITAYAQRGTTFTGTALIYGSGFNTRTVTRQFTMSITRRTSQEDADRYLEILERGGQDDLLRAIDSNDMGRFAFTGSVGLPLNAVVIDREGGETRIRAVFKRVLGFGELRRGYRSVDYPFTYIELHIDPRTGKGEGTIIPAARIRFKSARNGKADTVDIEDFGTFPGRLMGVQMRGAQLP